MFDKLPKRSSFIYIRKMSRTLKRTMIAVVLVIVALVLAVMVFMNQVPFGEIPSGERLERIKKSPHFKDGQFQNTEVTPDLTEGVSYYAVMKEFIFDKDKRNTPIDSLPSLKVDLKTLPVDKLTLVWFGHSSYFMQLDGKTFLADPVFSGSASPVKFTTRSYKGSDVYTTDDFPAIDYLFISHDHWDHLDYETMTKLKPQVRKVIVGLGVGAHLERWGYDKDQIIETDWNDSTSLDSGFVITTTPARHFSGRGFSRNKTLWASYVVKTPSSKVYIGGDSGYGKHYKDIGKQHGPFDLVLLECGQYDKSWKYIHMMPEEVVLAAQDLQAKRLMPVHWSKFSLGNHAWDDPILRVTKEAKLKNMPIVHPFIGEAIYLGDSILTENWWEKYK